MSEIWNLSTLCRCCHSDGCFKKLNLPYPSENSVEIYETMLQEALGIQVLRPTMDQASYMICDDCIKRLRDAFQFQQQVLACEQKFKVYCTNEQFQVKTEVELNDAENFEIDVQEDIHGDDDYSEKDDQKWHSVPVKEEVTIIKMVPVEVAVERTDVKSEEGENDGKMIIKNIKKTLNKPKPEKRMGHSSFYKHKQSLKTRLKVLETYIIKEKNKNEVTYSCKSCEGKYKTKKDIFKHIKEFHYNRCKCEQCDKPFKYERQLELHVRTVHGKTYTCQHCSRTYDNKYRFRAHEKTHINQTFQCDICQKVLRYKTTLRKHILQHNSENKGLLCDFCGRGFTQKSNLESHIKSVHLKMRPFSCSICNKSYTAKKHLKYHIKIAHSGNPKPYQCSLCTKSFACPKSFKIHRLTHENLFSCRYCSLVFNNKNDIDIHTKTHTKEHLLSSPFSCHICGKVLLSKFTLKRHLEIHSGVKRFVCNLCGLKFTQKSLVKRHHLRKHDPTVKIEKVKCDLCKKLVRDLDKHMEVHDADKRKCFCDMCGKNYPTNNALNRHKQRKHYGVSYDCDVCGKQYIQKGSLKRHKLKVHKIKKEIFDSVAVVQNLELTNVVT